MNFLGLGDRPTLVASTLPLVKRTPALAASGEALVVRVVVPPLKALPLRTSTSSQQKRCIAMFSR